MKSPKTDKPPTKRTSGLLQDITQATGKGEITVGDFVSMLKDRSCAFGVLIFSLPNSLPVPGIPGLSTITGVPIIYIALQIIEGRNAIWLPHRITAKHFKAEFLAKVIGKTLPAVIWLEKFLHPRWTAICQSAGERFIGFLIAVMAFILALPIAGTNFLCGISISLLALAILEDDGIFAVFAIVFALTSLYLMCEVIMLVTDAAVHWLSGFI